jgi:excinuclease UvrABC ATPase subunit
MRDDLIRITGARQHNLKNISVALPKNSLTVVTGVSGSGKSSLAFDTLYAEGQRRYVESLSAHAQQFLERLEKPDVDSIEGLSPAIAIEQHTAAANPRSTIATVTEIYDFLRVLYATCGTPHDPATGEPIHRYTTPEIAEAILAMPEGTRLMILAPLPESETMQPKKLFEKLARQGFVRVRVKGEVRDLEEKPEVEEGGAIDLVVDRLVVRPDARTRLMDSLPVALRWSGPASRVIVLVQEGEKWREQVFTTLYANPATGFRMPPLTPRHFSFNSHVGACSVCEGLGTQMWGDPDLMVPDKEKSLADGAVKTWWSKNPKLKAVHDRKIAALAAHFKVSDKVPFSSLPKEFKDALFYGTGKTPIKMDIAKSATTRVVGKPFEGLVNEAQRLVIESESEFVKQNVRRYMNPAPCAACKGRRLKPEFLAVTLAVNALGNGTISDFNDHHEATHDRTNAPTALESAWAHLRSTRGANREESPAETLRGNEAERRAQYEILREWCRKEALIFSPSSPLKLLDYGGEHDIYGLRHTPDEVIQRRLYKATRPWYAGITPRAVKLYKGGIRVAQDDATPLEYLERQLLQNRELGDTIRFEGMWETPEGPRLMVSQRVLMGELPEKGEVSSMLEGRGFGHVGENFWYRASDRLGVSDTKQANLIKGEDGLVDVIDVVMFRPTRAMLELWGIGSDVPVPRSSAISELAIDEFTSLTITGARAALQNLTLTSQQRQIVPEVLREMESRLRFLDDVGVGYLTLAREYGTLSGGEAQRIRLATQLGSRLSGVLYVLDEPSIGLHQRDNDRLLATLRELRDLGNTVVVVEHDEDTIKAADWVIDLGPGAGPRGGEIIGAGPVGEIAANAHSVTGQFLSGVAKIAVPKRRIVPPPLPKTKGGDVLETGWFTVHGATENNLQNIDVSFPVGCLICVTGVSGSGKSTLVDDILRREIARRLYQAKDTPGKHAGISGLQQFDKSVVIDQSPIGRSPRSNPATYIGAFNHIRELFSQLPAAKVRGYTPGTFSFNTAGGRCEMCEGDGVIRIDMHFLSDVYVTCEACEGKRYNREVLEVTFKGRNIADVLDMNLDEAAEFFRTVPGLGDKLRMMGSVGLGYLKLGQASNTLSGGEAQRIKLAAELSKRATGRTLYLLDEPTTGLHFSDIETLLRVLFGLRDQGNTLIIIEHNLDVIKCADWVIDMGPEGGAAGGRIVAEGPPETVARCEASLTGKYLRAKLF